MVKPFNIRMRTARDFLGLRNVDLAEILGVSPSLALAYAEVDNERTARVPEDERKGEVADILVLSLDYLSGRIEGPMWDPKMIALRPIWRERAREISDQNRPPHQTMIELVKIIQETSPVPLESWWLGGLLGLGGKGLERTTERLRQFMLGMGGPNAVLQKPMQRLSDFTGISERWIMTGDVNLLDSPTLQDVGEWANIVEQLRQAGYAPDKVHQHLPSFIALMQEYDRRLQ